MPVSKRIYAGLLVVLATVLSVFPILDVYDDYLQGEPLWLTLAENSVPLALVTTLFVATYWMYRHRERIHLSMVFRWSIAGIFGIMFILAWVLGIQSFQQEFKPVVAVTHTAIGGALAGSAVGYTAARVRRSRAEIATEKSRWESLFQNDPGGVVDLRFTEAGPIIDSANDSFERLFGLESDEIEATRLSAAVDHGDRDIEREITESITDGEMHAAEISTEIGDEQKFFKLRVVPYGIGQNQQRAFAIYTDVTELRETEAELETQMHQLEASNERLQQFAYIASHDLQEPLRMVSSYMSLLETEYREELDEEAQEYIDFAADGANRMQDMIDELLAYSRVRTQGKEFSETNATAVLEDTLQDLELRIDESGASVSYDELPTIDADRNQLGQLFQNLVENAIDHTDSPSIHVGSQRRDGAAVFSVSDDGQGIPESQQETIFELFKRGDRDGDGTGMGLAICDRIVSRHGGEIWVESDEGAGTTFYFSIPE